MWEIVDREVDPESVTETERMKIKTGWLVTVKVYYNSSGFAGVSKGRLQHMSLTNVNDPKYSWKIGKA